MGDLQQLASVKEFHADKHMLRAIAMEISNENVQLMRARQQEDLYSKRSDAKRKCELLAQDIQRNTSEYEANREQSARIQLERNQKLDGATTKEMNPARGVKP